MIRILNIVCAAGDLAARLARAMSWLVLLAIIVVVVSVAGSAAGLSEILSWNGDTLLFGERLTLTGLGELQWHLFGLLVIFGGLQALSEDQHVRVDFLYQSFGRRKKLLVNLAGHIFFLIPFLVVIIDRSLPAVELAYRSGAGSDYGGLQDRYLIKSVLPLGFVLLLFLTVCQVIEYAIRLSIPALDEEIEKVE
ncbi:TRAP transporter small permease subunit [Sulfitobacter sp. 1A16787]|uniref:TRAP transporter small permease subunit n=1 Tax=Sulfitobacter sp. 1A16787 TaxID=3368571 RepID=UPI0037460E6E